MGLYWSAVKTLGALAWMSKPLHVVIMAAGEGTRMKSALPKVLHTIGGRPMLEHMLETVAALKPAAVHVVVGNGADEVRAAFGLLDRLLPGEER